MSQMTTRQPKRRVARGQRRLAKREVVGYDKGDRACRRDIFLAIRCFGAAA
jgi:hypothetical protein